jgi:hypothetical protein
MTRRWLRGRIAVDIESAREVRRMAVFLRQEIGALCVTKNSSPERLSGEKVSASWRSTESERYHVATAVLGSRPALTVETHFRGRKTFLHYHWCRLPSRVSKDDGLSELSALARARTHRPTNKSVKCLISSVFHSLPNTPQHTLQLQPTRISSASTPNNE